MVPARPPARLRTASSAILLGLCCLARALVRNNVSGVLSRSSPAVAICITGRIDAESFATTAPNLRDVVVDSIREVAEADIFFYVKGDNLSPHLRSLLASFSPTVADVYGGEEPIDDFLESGRFNLLSQAHDEAFYTDEHDDGLEESTMRGKTKHAWIQRYQWNECWKYVVKTEQELGRPYDFILRTRPDVIFNKDIIVPARWSIWSEEVASTGVAHGICKCHRPDLMSREKPPVQDLMFVGSRRTAAVFMTTWERRHETPEGLYMNGENCYMYTDGRDAFECLSVADLKRHHFDMTVATELQRPGSVPSQKKVSKYAIPGFSSTCDFFTAKKNDGDRWFADGVAIYGHFPAATRICLEQNRAK